MTIRGERIEGVSIGKGAVDTGISTGLLYDEWDAATSCGFTGSDLLAWHQGDARFPLRFKAMVVAFHRLRRLVRLHSEAAVNRATERAARRARGRGGGGPRRGGRRGGRRRGRRR